MTSTESAVQALVQFFTRDVDTAYRVLRSHRPNLDGECLGCATQLGPHRYPAERNPWPCRLARAAGVACEQVSRRPVPVLKPLLQVKSERPFLAAIERNATEVTAPMRAVRRTPSTAPSIPAGAPKHGKRN